MIQATLFTDPGCPWAYSERPALRVLQWRYGAQLAWRLVLIGLADDRRQYERRGYSAARMAQGNLFFRRYGMPLVPAPKARVAATGPACRAVVATRRLTPGREWAVLEALQLANFTTPLLLDDAGGLGQVIDDVAGVDGAAVIAALDSDEVMADYEQDKAESRSAAGSAAELQGKTATTDGPVRFTAPSLILERDGRRLVAGGFQPVEAYDVLVANLDPGLERRDRPPGPAPLLEHFPEGLTTQEVAALLAAANETPDRARAEALLAELLGQGQAERLPAGDDALWRWCG